MNKNLKTLCAAVAITLMPVGATCYAKTAISERYETISVSASVDNENTENGVERKGASEEGEFSIDDVLRFKCEKDKTDQYMGKEIVLKVKVCKVKMSDDMAYVMSKEGNVKKAKCSMPKDEAKKFKEGDEIILKGTLKNIKGNKVYLEDAKVLKVSDMNNKEYNKDKYKEKDSKDSHDKEKCPKDEQKDKCDDKKKDDKEDKKDKCTNNEEEQENKEKDVKTSNDEKKEKDNSSKPTNREKKVEDKKEEKN